MHTISLSSLLLLISSSAINTMATPVNVGDHRPVLQAREEDCVFECKDTTFFTPDGERYKVLDRYADPISKRCVYRTQLIYPKKRNPPTVTISTAPCGWWGGGYKPQDLDGTPDKPKDLDVVRDEQAFIKLKELYSAGYENIRNPQLKFIVLKHWPNIKPMLKTKSGSAYFHTIIRSRGDLAACKITRDNALAGYLRMIRNMAQQGVVVHWENYWKLGISFLDFVWFSEDLYDAHPIGIPYINSAYGPAAPNAQAMQIIYSKANAEFNTWYPASDPTRVAATFGLIKRDPLCNQPQS
ncbi:hypothetical protein FRC03_006009 [Tulasnella sp. 419]|nr:hypothetical protein FRC03_006009 [Tulasnella sp. 419]